MPKEDQDHLQQAHKTNGTDNPAIPVFVRSADFRAHYANFVRVNFNAFDVSMLFGQAAVAPERQDQVAIEMTTRVTFDVIEAKLIIQMLTNTVTAYEKKYGIVAIPDDVKLPQAGEEGKTEGV